jgi:5-methylcytosine-specific restriction endonuclease McrA
MPWFNVDDGFAFHRKAVKAGNSAIGLWTRAGSLCAQQLTDGFVPAEMVKVLGTAAQARKLVAAGLWVEVEGGFQFHEWTEYQRTRDQVVADRAYAARKSSLYRDPDLLKAVRRRDGDRCRYCGALVIWTDRRGPAGATFDHVDPSGSNALENLVVACRSCNSKKNARTPPQAGMPLLAAKSLGISSGDAGQNVEYLERNKSDLESNQDEPSTYQAPIPSTPIPSTVEEKKKTSSSSPRKRGTRIPDDFTATPDMVAWARDRVPHVDGRTETEKFINYWQAKSGPGATKVDWPATWRNWMLNAAERAPARASPGFQSQTDANIAALLTRPALRALPGGDS